MTAIFKRVSVKKFNQFANGPSALRFNKDKLGGKIVRYYFKDTELISIIDGYFFISIEEELKFFIRKDLL